MIVLGMHGTNIYISSALEYAIEPNFKLHWNPIYPHGTNKIRALSRFKLPRQQRVSFVSPSSLPSLADIYQPFLVYHSNLSISPAFFYQSIN